VIASTFKDWQVLLLRFIRVFLWVGHPRCSHVTYFACQIAAIDVIRGVKASNGGTLPQDWKKRILQDERVKPRAKEMSAAALPPLASSFVFDL
jgi:hypothetical protein